MLGQLRTAIEGKDWGGALAAALAWWRDTRAPEIADLVDALGAHCTLPAPPKRELHAWWMLHASTYNPVHVTALARRANDRMLRSDVKFAEVREWYAGNAVVKQLIEPYAEATHTIFAGNLNVIHRLAAMFTWAPDPRAAQICARWFAEGRLYWSMPDFVSITPKFYELLAEHMIALRDTRVERWIASTLAHPRGRTPALRAHQAALARRVLDALADATLLADPDRDQVRAWCRELAQPVDDRIEREEQALWEEVMRDPDDLGTRLVLADALIEQDDPRGHVIAMQCNPDRRVQREARRLLDEHWFEFFGDAALVIDKRDCEFRAGMLDVLAIGVRDAPDWAYVTLARHRELAAVRWLRVGRHVTGEQVVRVLRDLPRPPARLTLARNGLELMHARKPWPMREIELRYRQSVVAGPTLEDALRMLGETFPELEQLVIDTYREPRESIALVPRLPELFPGLQTIALQDRDWNWRGTRADCAAPPQPPA